MPPAPPAHARGARRPFTPYFAALAVANVRCFHEPQTLSLGREGAPSRWTLIVGDHGTGKTTLLQILASLRPQFRHTRGPYSSTPVLDCAAWPGLYWGGSVRGAAFSTAPAPHRSVSLSFAFRRALTEPTQLTDHIAQEYPADSAPVVVRPASSAGLGSHWPCTTLVVGYAAHRALRPQHPPALAGTTDAPSAHVAHLFDPSEPLVSCESWLLRRARLAAQLRPDTPELARANAALERVRALLLAAVPELTALDVIAQGPEPRVRALTPHGPAPLTQLSHAQQSTLAWLTDLAARMIACYPVSEDPLGEPAVVLLDEIERQMHPRAQRALLATLDAHLPNVQWVVTTQSPFVVHAAPPDAHLVALTLDGPRAHINNDPPRAASFDALLAGPLFRL